MLTHVCTHWVFADSLCWRNSSGPASALAYLDCLSVSLTSGLGVSLVLWWRVLKKDTDFFRIAVSLKSKAWILVHPFWVTATASRFQPIQWSSSPDCLSCVSQASVSDAEMTALQRLPISHNWVNQFSMTNLYCISYWSLLGRWQIQSQCIQSSLNNHYLSINCFRKMQIYIWHVIIYLDI